VQRITLAQPSSPDEFATYFQKKISQENGARLDLLQQGRTACVFSTYFAKSDQNEEQMMVCLVFSEVKTPQRAQSDPVCDQAEPSSRSPSSELQLKAWKAQFSQTGAQHGALTSGSSQMHEVRFPPANHADGRE